MRISGISQRTPTMVYDLRPMHLYTYISQLYLSSHFIRNDSRSIYSEYAILTIDKKFDPFLFAKKDFHTNS